MGRRSTSAGDLIQANQSTIISYPTATYTAMCWYKSDHVPNTSQVSLIVAADDLANVNTGFAWDHTSSAYVGSWYQESAGSTFPNAQLTGPFVAGTWCLIGGSYDGTNIRAWYNGVAQATVSAIAANSGHPTLFHGKLYVGATSPLGVFGETGYWTVALTANEIAALATGIPFSWVRPSALMSGSLLRGTGNLDVDTALPGLRGYVSYGPTPAEDAPLQRRYQPQVRKMFAVGGTTAAWTPVNKIQRNWLSRRGLG
jgi:hypothetical protein